MGVASAWILRGRWRSASTSAWRSSTNFPNTGQAHSSPIESAALAYVEEVTRNKRASDATFETLRKHFSEREIVEITWLNAIENYYNLINIPLEIESDGFCAIAQAQAT